MNDEEVLKNKDQFPYRQGVLGLILNDQQEVLIVQMPTYKDNEWRFPGGGIDKGEDPKKALLRELKEELGCQFFEVGTQSQYKTHHNWPGETILRRYKEKGELFQGQEQVQFLVKFTGQKSDLKPDPGEIKNLKWVKLDQLEPYFIFPGQWDITQKVIEELVR